MGTQEVAPVPDELAINAAAAKPRRTKLIGSVVALIVLLTGAAFVGGRLLNQAAPQGGPGDVVPVGDPAGGQGVSVEMVPAKELPTTEPDALGLFAERKDNSIYVTIGDEFAMRVDKNGNVDLQTNGNGDKLEVVVTSDTTLYKSVMPDAVPSGGGKVQQQVAPGSLNEISANSIVSAWGERRGDRLIARVLVYEQPMVLGKP